MPKKFLLFLFCAIFSSFALFAFSGRVISPVEGRFANKQSLILDLNDGAEAFYSYTSTNPLNSGFAYDGQVLIDAIGDVRLKIVVQKGNEKEEYEINYTVNEVGNPFAEGTFEKEFIDRILNENVLPCTSENVINIPKIFSVAIGDGEKPLLSGATLAVSADNKLSRFIPCTVSDGKINWRFIVYLSAGEAGTFSLVDVPFEISDWQTFHFTGKNLIWCIDDGLWSASHSEVNIDRSKAHIIYWQDVAYKSANTIHSFNLPPKPELEIKNFNNAVSFSLDGDFRYRMKILESGALGDTHENSGLYSTLTFDTFEGDFIDADAVFSIYCDGVYQGELSSHYIIDRQAPLPPKFISSEPGNYARHDVSLKIESEKDAKIYVCVLGPYELNSNSYLDNNSEVDFIKPGEFSLYKYDSIELHAGIEKTVSYKAFAYAEDNYGNVSNISTYKVIIDEYNYFIDGNATNFAADGSRLHPFNSFSQALKIINEGKFVHFFVSGTVNLPKGESIISSNCSFTGISDARFVLSPSSYILVQDASVEMQNFVIQKNLENASQSEQRFFVFERAAASFEDCEILGNFAQSGTALSVEASIVTFKKSGLTTQSTVYACGISSNNSRISLLESHFASISDTAVNFSVKGGSLELKSSDCKVISNLGRIVEATGANLKLISNKYTGDFEREVRGVSPIWKDEKSLIIEDKNNTSEGF